jgi:hypothetical protein
MPYVNIDIEDIYSDLSEREIKNLIEWLREDGHLTEKGSKYETSPSGIQQMFDDDIEKIRNSYFQISKEDFFTINQMTKKY